MYFYVVVLNPIDIISSKGNKKNQQLALYTVIVCYFGSGPFSTKSVIMVISNFYITAKRQSNVAAAVLR